MIVHRPATSDDLDFVIASWSSSYKTAHTAGLIHTDDWADVMHRQIGRVLERPDARTLVAFEKSDPDFLYGFISGDTSDAIPVVFYVYVKEAYRREKIGSGLFAALGVEPLHRFVYCCKTGVVTKLTHKIPNARFNNNEARFPKDARRDPL